MGFRVSRGFLVSTCLLLGASGCAEEAEEVDAASLNEFQRDILAAHNAVRAQVSASEALPPLKWSAQAEKVAAAWAEGCHFEHNPDRGRLGENLAADPRNVWPTQEAMVSDWASEARYYDSASNTCAPGEECGHYTQLVWRETTHVGCVMKVCTTNSPWTPPVPQWKLWVCNYTPPGNVAGQRPY
jgi:uncharacterized protein YkwD